MNWYVQIIEYEYPHGEGDGDRVVKQLGPFSSKRAAEQCEAGAVRNLNRNQFCTYIVEVEHEPEND